MTALVEGANDWGFVSGRVAVLEGRLLPHDFYQSLLAHRHVEDLLRQLQDTPLSDAVTAASGWEDWSAIIDRYFYEQVASLRKDCPDPRVPDLFLLQGDYQNLKRALTGQRFYPFPHAVLTEELLSAVAGGDLSGLPSPYRETAQSAKALLEEGRSAAELDRVLDAAYLRHLLAASDEVNVPLIRDYFSEYVLSRVILMLWRGALTGAALNTIGDRLLPLGALSQVVRDLIGAGDPKNWAGLVPGTIGHLLNEHVSAGDTEAPQRFDLDVTNLLMNTARLGVGQVFGPERVFAYLTALATEAYNLKLVVCGRLSRVDADMLKRRLRKTHA